MFDDLGVWKLLVTNADPRDLDEFVRDWLGGLIDYDSSHNSGLVITLGVYLDGDGAYEATARKLNIHRSTLRYRLARIEQLSGRDLGDSDLRFNLALAGRPWSALRAMGAVSTRGPDRHEPLAWI